MALNPAMNIQLTCVGVEKKMQSNTMCTITLRVTGSDSNYPMLNATTDLVFTMQESTNADQFVVGQTYTVVLQ